MTHPELTMEQVEQIQDCAADMLDSKLRYEIRPDTLYDICTAALAHLRSQPAGYVSVPREPTMEMLDAALFREPRHEHNYKNDHEMYASIYKAMLAASPPAGEGVDEREDSFHG